MAFDEVYDRVTEAFPEVETIVADSAYETPHICKKVFEDGRVLSTAYKRPQTYFHHSWPPFMATFQHLFHHLLLILPLMNEKAQLLLDFFDRLRAGAGAKGPGPRSFRARSAQPPPPLRRSFTMPS